MPEPTDTNPASPAPDEPPEPNEPGDVDFRGRAGRWLAPQGGASTGSCLAGGIAIVIVSAVLALALADYVRSHLH